MKSIMFSGLNQKVTNTTGKTYKGSSSTEINVDYSNVNWAGTSTERLQPVTVLVDIQLSGEARKNRSMDNIICELMSNNNLIQEILSS